MYIFLLFFLFSLNNIFAVAFEEKIKICSSCHGIDGNSINPAWPKIAGQSKGYLVKQLLDYKLGKEDGGRYNVIMYGIIKNFSYNDIDDMADYYSIKKQSLGNVNNYNEDGKNIYFTGDSNRNIIACFTCHGYDGNGNDVSLIPKLSGQHSVYLIQQLNNYKNNDRINFDIMNDIVSRMNGDDINNVANYISSM